MKPAFSARTVIGKGLLFVVVVLGSAHLLRSQSATGTTSGQSNPAPADPRTALKAGFYDAGEAIRGMQHVASLKKPEQFQPPPPKPDAKAMEKLFSQLGYSNSDM